MSQPKAPKAATTSAADLDAALVVGTLSSDPVWRELPSGTTMCTLEVTTRSGEGHARSVPIVQFDPPRRLDRLAKGDRVVVAGAVVRRFFRTGGATVSRTEVTATWVKRETSASRRELVRWGTDHLANTADPG
ncbi:MAG: single-stranded DNA-binding protein [Actinomycetia bacterium]|nr:single-stranded DNA-binding protein [Actinomycetes bacterium]MCP4962972.1 single-stranded DNA-binding protein [Actinomycetes bacterium]